MLLSRDPSQIKRYTQTKVKGWEKIFRANGKEKAGVAVLISDKIDFKNKGYSKRKRTLHNDKENNPTRGYNPTKHLCSQYRST